MAESQRRTGPRRRALRLVFDYDGDRVLLRRSEPLDKQVAASDPLLRVGDAARRSGFWVEIRDRQARVLWRRVLEDPRNLSVEHPSGERAGTLGRVDVERPVGSFRVLVPDLPAGREVALVASPLGPVGPDGRVGHRGSGGARALARFDLATGYPIAAEPDAEPAGDDWPPGPDAEA